MNSTTACWKAAGSKHVDQRRRSCGRAAPPALTAQRQAHALVVEAHAHGAATLKALQRHTHLPLRVHRHKRDRRLARGAGEHEDGARLVLDLRARGTIDKARVALVREVQCEAEVVRLCRACRRSCRRTSARKPHAEAAHRVLGRSGLS